MPAYKASRPRQDETQENLPDHHDRTGKRLNQWITVRQPWQYFLRELRTADAWLPWVPRQSAAAIPYIPVSTAPVLRLAHFRAVISCKVGISCCSMAICFCCFSIKDGILSSAACGYRADSANPNGRAPDTPQRYFSPLTPSTKKALRSNEPERCTRCGQADSAPYSCQWYGKPRPCMSWLWCSSRPSLSLRVACCRLSNSVSLLPL